MVIYKCICNALLTDFPFNDQNKVATTSYYLGTGQQSNSKEEMFEC